MQLKRQASLILLLSLALFSPLFQPYLINPNIIPFYSSSLLFLLWAGYIFVHHHEIMIKNSVALILCMMLPAIFLAYPVISPYIVAFIVSAFVFIAATQRHSASNQWYLTIFVAASAVWTLLALVVWFGWTGGELIHIGLWALTADAQLKLAGSFVNGNVLAIFNACAWVIVVAKALRSGHWYWWLLAFFFLLCLFSSLAWGAWLAVFPVFIWMVMYCYKQKRFRDLFVMLCSIPLAWLLAQAVVEYAMDESSLGYEVRMQQTQVHGIDERKLIWLASFAMFREHPWFGIGLGRFDAHYLTYQSKVLAELDTPLPEQIAANSAHNLLLQLMAEAGVFGMAFWLMVTVVLLKLSWIYRWQLTSRTWPFLACTWLLWIQGMGNITLSRPYPMLMFALFLGVACAPLLKLRGGSTIRVDKRLLLAMTIILLFTLAWSTVQKTAYWLDYERLILSADKIGSKEKAELTAKLVGEPTVLPFLIEGIVSDHLLEAKRQASMMALQPYVQKALLLRQDPLLLQQQFYMFVLTNKWNEACGIAHILMPMSSQVNNSAAYLDACAHKPPKSFVFFAVH